MEKKLRELDKNIKSILKRSYALYHIHTWQIPMEKPGIQMQATLLMEEAEMLYADYTELKTYLTLK